MSKMDDLRAMREARYEEARARAAAAPAVSTSKARPTRPATRPAKPAPTAEATPVEPDQETCGHRNISGRTCTREAGHAAKSHRYS
jgi:hypothetical protein